MLKNICVLKRYIHVYIPILATKCTLYNKIPINRMSTQ